MGWNLRVAASAVWSLFPQKLRRPDPSLTTATPREVLIFGLRIPFGFRISDLGILPLFLAASVAAQAPLPTAKPVPRLQALPLPHDEISFQREGAELTRYHYSTNQFRPFLYPVIGPAGRSLTRMGHPHDQQSHKHHNSVWIAHHIVNGASFWEDRPTNTIVHSVLERIEDGPDTASVVVLNAWRSGSKVLLWERRQITVQSLPANEWLLTIDLNLAANGEPVTLGETAFGLMAVRVAKTIGVHDGGGMIRNSEGGINEAGCFRKPAKWVDYSGPITPAATEGITLMDHPANYNHPSAFHVRDDGWMGSALTFGGAKVIEPGKPLVLRYGLYVHSGVPEAAALNRRFDEFARSPRPDLSLKPKP